MRTNSLGDERERLAVGHRELIFKRFPTNEIKVESNDDNGTVYRNGPAGIRIQSTIVPGDPVSRICSLAEEMDAELVIVGNRGLGNIGAVVLGSVSEKVVRKCSRSVLVVKGDVSDRSNWEAMAGTQTTSQRLRTG